VSKGGRKAPAVSTMQWENHDVRPHEETGRKTQIERDPLVAMCG
jgi:hypothetical protein